MARSRCAGLDGAVAGVQQGLTRGDSLEGGAERVGQQLGGRRGRRGEVPKVVSEHPRWEQSLQYFGASLVIYSVITSLDYSSESLVLLRAADLGMVCI